MNQDIQELEDTLDGTYPGSLMARLTRILLKLANGFEGRLRDLEKRFEDSEG